MVQRPFYERDGTCQVYVLHPPGGVVGGDELELGATLGAGARALLTTPAASKIYASQRHRAQQRQRFSIAAGASLEWLPQETIVYDGARFHGELSVELAPGAHFSGWEITCVGRDAHGFRSGEYSQRWLLSRGERPLWGERAAFRGDDPFLTAAWGLAGRPVMGTFVSTGADPSLADTIREELDGSDESWTSVTCMRDVLVARYLGYSAETAKRAFARAWAHVRRSTQGRSAEAPRIWAT